MYDHLPGCVRKVGGARHECHAGVYPPPPPPPPLPPLPPPPRPPLGKPSTWCRRRSQSRRINDEDCILSHPSFAFSQICKICAESHDVYAMFEFPVFLVIMHRADTETMLTCTSWDNRHCQIANFFIGPRYTKQIWSQKMAWFPCVLEFCLGLETKKIANLFLPITWDVRVPKCRPPILMFYDLVYRMYFADLPLDPSVKDNAT